MNGDGGLITSVASGGFGEQVGLRAGDRLLRINGHALRDVIDVQFYGAEEEVTLDVERSNTHLCLYGSPGDVAGWGVEFAEPLFDGLRTCRNRCPFCFVTGLPRGLRPSLYVRDDDYRLSFLYGNFVTLTNLTESDWQRLAEQRLSPLHVSVQATEPDLRRHLLGGRPVPDIREQIECLARIGITVEAQVVVCPGLNDGRALEQTLSDLWALHENVESVALVPVGMTRHHPARLQPVTPELARAILALAGRWRRLACRESGMHWAYPSDEMYLLAGRPVPSAKSYDGFPQLANGVGLLRRFLDDWKRTERRLARHAPRPQVAGATLVSGSAFLPLLQAVAGGLSHYLRIPCRAEAVANRLFGDDVSVAGLLGGEDVVSALSQRELLDVVVLPRSMFDAAGERTLDEWTPDGIASALGRPVALAEMPAELVRILTRSDRVAEGRPGGYRPVR